MSMIAAYLRVSTDAQSHASQRGEVERWLVGNGHEPEVVTWFIDRESGATFDRTAYKRMREAIFNGEFDTVVVWRLDRLGRSIREGINAVGDLCDKGVRLVSVRETLDLSGTIGQIIAAVLFGVAQSELEANKQRRDAGIAAAKSRGVYKGGKEGRLERMRYLPSDTDRIKKVDVVKEAAKLRTTGNSYAVIERHLGVAHRTVKKYLRVAADEGLISDADI